MKKLIFLLLLTTGLAFGVQPVKSIPLPTVDSYEMALPAGQVTTYATVDENTGAAVQVPKIEPPASTVVDALNIPEKGSELGDWIYWVMSLIVLALYEIIFRLIPTAKSVSIVTIIYNILNLILRDKAAGGGMFKVQRE